MEVYSAALSEQANAVLRDCDVLLQPGPVTGPPRIGHYQGRSALWTLNGVAGRVPFQGIWNATGQPSMIVPAGRDRDGLPIATYAADEVHYLVDLPAKEHWEVQTALLRRHTPLVLDDLA